MDKQIQAGALFIERLTVVSWILTVAPYLVRRRSGKYKIYFIDASNPGIFTARLSLLFFRIRIERLNFRLVDIRDEKGKLLRLRIAYFDFSEVQKDILSRSFFQKIQHSQAKKNRIPTFLAKQIASFFDIYSDTTVMRAQILIQVIAWKRKKDNPDRAVESILFMNKRLWLEEIRRYASKYNVKIIPMRQCRFNLKNFLALASGSRMKIFQGMYFYIRKEGLINFLKELFFPEHKSGPAAPGRTLERINTGAREAVSPKLAVEYYGHLNLDRPELHSDLFFWQQSQMSSKDILITFSCARSPLDKEKWQEIKKHGMAAIALLPEAVTVSEAQVFYHWTKRPEADDFNLIVESSRKASEKKWLRRQMSYYSIYYNYWLDFFERHKVKVYLSWYKYSSHHCIIADALEHLGGVTAIYQRAFEEFPSFETVIASDVAFGFSRANIEIERRSGSRVPYYVVAGYFGGHRPALLKEPARKVRHALKQNGARRILAYFDENSGGDSRWHTGHEFMRVNYEFLLEKVLRDPGLGLILKPKASSTLRRRLGNVADLLKRAEGTGRCFTFEGGELHNSYSPVIAALASDITVHGHCNVATAGMESALAGVPTLLMDREGWPVSSLYKLGKGRVVFTGWHQLWEACESHWAVPGGIAGFGDWSLMLDELDSFRDGRAAERIGTYLKWLLDGFKSKLPRETVMADAAERYCKIWGKDKVVEIKN